MAQNRSRISRPRTHLEHPEWIQQDTRLDMTTRAMACEASLWRQHSTAPEYCQTRSITDLVRAYPYSAQRILSASADRSNQLKPNVDGKNAILQCGLSCPESKEWSRDEAYVAKRMTRTNPGDSCADIMLHFDSSWTYDKSQDFKDADNEYGEELAGHIEGRSGGFPSHAMEPDEKSTAIKGKSSRKPVSREKRRKAWIREHVARVLGEAEPLCVDTSWPSCNYTGRKYKTCESVSSARNCLKKVGIFPDSYPNFTLLRFPI